jgi:dipeptidyl aminopeptidase/acylaminoacyl peptidase
VYELTGVADPRLSPDGRTVAYTVYAVDKDANEYRRAIWLVALDGSEEPRRLTSGEKQDADPRWSPDGRFLAFVSKRGESKTAQLYVLPVHGGEPRKLTDLKEDVEQIGWSPDGTRLAFSSRVRDAAYDEEDEKKRAPRRFRRLSFKLDSEGWIGDRRRQIFTVAADGSREPMQLTEGDYEHAYPTWTPDGRRVAFVGNRNDDWDLELHNAIYAVDADGGGEPQKLTRSECTFEAPVFSPDGARIACRLGPGGFDYPRHTQIAVVDVATGDERVLTRSLDRNCGPFPEIREPIWDGDAVVFAVEDEGYVHVYRVAAAASTEPELLVGGEVWVSGYDARGGTLVHVAQNSTELPELTVGDRKLTDVGTAFTTGRALVEPEKFTVTSTEGAEVDAWLIRPAEFDDAKRYPVLLNIHGGPFTQYGDKFFDEFQVWAGAGYAVLFCNPRGSAGYSEEWGRAIRGPVEGGPGWGTRDYDDVMAVVDAALERFDFLDGDRMGVIGGSYGGYLTSWIVAHDKRFAAACSERALNDWYSDWGTADIGWFFCKAYGGSLIYEDREPYLKHSPFTYAHQIETPLLILHSEDDLRCPMGQAEQLFTTLRVLKRDVELVRVPAESHELTRSGSPLHRVMRFELVLEWFDRYLK